jgi:threonine/homoserine/homoserine lactone efflux protein
MRLLLLALFAYVLGYVAAVPIGPSQVEIAKRAVANEVLAALMLVAGSVLSDVTYGAIGLLGFAAIFRRPGVEAVFDVTGGLLVLVLAYFTYRHSARDERIGGASPALRSRSLSFATGLSLAITNPPIVFWWLLGAKLATDIGLTAMQSVAHAAVFIGFGGLGIASYLITLTLVVRRVKHLLSVETQQRLYHVMAVFLVAVGFYLLIAGLHASLVWHAARMARRGA